MEMFEYSFQFYCKRAAVVCAYNPQRQQCQVCKIIRELNEERLKETLIRKRAELMESDTMATREKGVDILVRNLKTHRLGTTRKMRERFLKHLKAPHLIPAGVYAWNHPEALNFIEEQEIEQNKDKNDPRIVKKIWKKKKRGVVGYNLYELKYVRSDYIVFTEVHKNGFEQLYGLYDIR